MQLEGMNILVAGLALSGRAAARLCLKKGGRVTVTDLKPSQELSQAADELAALGARLVLGRHQIQDFTQADLVVVSPGMPLTSKYLQAAIKAGVPVIGELELASRFISAPLAAITGANGKTTVTSLLGHILAAANRKVFVGGNIGHPLSLAAEDGYEAVVAEVSSFQLEAIESFHPAVAVLLNITPDHLDRYASFEHYAAAKRRIFINQGEGDLAVLNLDDEPSRASQTRARKAFFSRRQRLETGACLDQGRIVIREAGRELAGLDCAELGLAGAHNQENVMAATLAAMGRGVDPQAALKAAAGFRPLAHRMQPVGVVNGVEYYNDSKATNVDAVAKGLEGFDRPVVLIAGGRDKAGDFGQLAPLAAEKVKHLVLIGEAAGKMEEALSGVAPVTRAASLEEAVALAASLAAPGEIVALSPACASFDMFDSYIHRGEVFTRLVAQLGRAR